MSHHHHPDTSNILVSVINFIAIVFGYVTGFFSSIVLWVHNNLPDMAESEDFPDMHEIISAIILGVVTTSVAFIVQKLLHFLWNSLKSLINKKI